MHANLEIEKRFANVNCGEMINTLLKLGAQHIKTKLFKITTFRVPSPIQYLRVRDEGDQITVTVKKPQTGSKFLIEHETTVGDVDSTISILETLGYQKSYYVEKIRAIYKWKNTEIVFDHYPGLMPIMEIESQTEEELEQLIKILKLKDEPEFGTKTLYKSYYGIPTSAERKSGLTFENAAEYLKKHATKNYELMLNILEIQTKIISNLV